VEEAIGFAWNARRIDLNQGRERLRWRAQGDVQSSALV
jgi:hypothetical protein